MLDLIGARKVRQALNVTRLIVDDVHLCVSLRDSKDIWQLIFFKEDQKF